MSLLFQNIAPEHPMRIGPALLYYIKQGKPVEKITIYLTHSNIHRIHQGDVENARMADVSKTIRMTYPLALTVTDTQGKEHIMDFRSNQVPWDLALETKKKKDSGYSSATAIAPTPKQVELTRDEQAMMDELFEPFFLRAATEYRLLRRQVEREMILARLRQQRDQQQLQDTPHE